MFWGELDITLQWGTLFIHPNKSCSVVHMTNMSVDGNNDRDVCCRADLTSCWYFLNTGVVGIHNMAFLDRLHECFFLKNEFCRFFKAQQHVFTNLVCIFPVIVKRIKAFLGQCASCVELRRKPNAFPGVSVYTGSFQTKYRAVAHARFGNLQNVFYTIIRSYINPRF